MDRLLTIGARFEGPPGHANGGWICGTLAGEGPARVTLRRPVPVERELRFDGAALRAADGEDDAVLAEVERFAGGRAPLTATLDAAAAAASPTAPLGARAPRVSLARAREAASRTPLAARHPFPGCFGCGPGHPAGLHCLAGPVDGADGAWAVDWTPEEAGPPWVWAALDCPSSAPVVPVDGDPPHVLGRMEAEVLGDVVPGEPHVVVAWALPGGAGRRSLSASALLGPGGDVVAVARATWVALR